MGENMSKLSITIEGYTFEVDVSLLPNNAEQIIGEVNGNPVELTVPNLESASDDLLWGIVDDRPYEVFIDRDLGWIKSQRGMHALEFHDLEAPVLRGTVSDFFAAQQPLARVLS